MTYLIVIVTFILFAIKGQVFIDPDFGWHIKTGEYISKSGIPRTDIFSYTMPSFPWIDHEWLTNYLMFKAMEHIEYLGLAFIFSLLALLSLIASVGIPNNINKRIVFIITAGVIFPAFGIRPQVISWLFLAILTIFLYRENFWKKYKLFLPVLFLIWVNLHGAFASGIVILGFFILFKTIRKRSIIIDYYIVFFLCLVATLINPYGFRIWKEVIVQFTDTPLYRRQIAEWMPSIFSGNTIFALFLAMICSLTFYMRRKFLLENKALVVVLAYQAVFTTRHIPIFTIMTAPLVMKLLEIFQKNLTTKESMRRFRISLNFLLVISISTVIITAILNIRAMRKVNESDFYPKNAVEFLRKSNFEGQILNSYDWGGYLIWKYPEKKVFIDGRMPSMKRDTAPTSELTWAYKTYTELYKEGVDIDTIEKLPINIILIRNDPDLDIEKKEPNIVARIARLFIDVEDISVFTKKLKDSGNWEIVHRDDIATVYKRQKI